MIVPVDIKQNKIELLLSALKVAESEYTKLGNWAAAQQVSKLNSSLRKQIFSYTPVKEYD